MWISKTFRNSGTMYLVTGTVLIVAIIFILITLNPYLFGQETARYAPQADIGIKSAGIDSNGVASITLKHLGGDPVDFEDSGVTKIIASLNGGTFVEINAHDDITTSNVIEGPGIMKAGDMKKLLLASDYAGKINAFVSTTPASRLSSGEIINIRIIDVKTNQLIVAKDIML